MKCYVVDDFFDLGLVYSLAKLVPPGAEQNLGRLSKTQIVLHIVRVQTNAFLCVISLDVLGHFLFDSPPSGLYLYFHQPM